MSDRSHNASFAAYTAATYSLSVVESEIISCLFALQETAPPFTRNAYPEIALRSSAILPSASAYPSNSRTLLPYDNQRSRVPFKQRKILLTASQWTIPGFVEKRDTVCTANVM